MIFDFRKTASSVVKCLTANFSNPSSISEKEEKEPVKDKIESPVNIKQEQKDEDLLADKDSDIEVVDEEDSCNINTLDLLAELQNHQGTENLVYMKSISDSE